MSRHSVVKQGADWDENCYRAKFLRAPVLQGPREIFGHFVAGCILYIEISCILNTHFGKGASSDFVNLSLSQ
jgi:hypothetical protein